jgi:hypothetical protein
MSTIKLPRIPIEEFVAVRFTMPGDKHTELLDYLTYFNESHQSEVDLKALLPHLVTVFMAEDRAFVRWRAARAATQAGTVLTKPAKPPRRMPAESS